MKVIIIGSQGQLGKELVTTFEQETQFDVITLSKNDLDITSQSDVNQVIKQTKPDIVINAAAYTAVDQCEVEYKKAYEVNALGAFYIARAANQVGATVVYISSDYIFNGKKDDPYQEDDIPDPLSVYGMSKLLGEQFVTFASTKSYIIRTSWLYGHHGKNFVNTILQLSEKGKEIHVVNDQIGSPTYTKDLALTIKQLIGKEYGIYHVTNSGACSWHTFAKAILDSNQLDSTNIKPISTEQFGALAPRPAYSVLGHKSVEREGLKMRSWGEALKEFMERRKDND